MPSTSDILAGTLIVGGLGLVAFTAYEARVIFGPKSSGWSLAPPTAPGGGGFIDKDTGKATGGFLSTILKQPEVYNNVVENMGHPEAAIPIPTKTSGTATAGHHPAAPIPPVAAGSTPPTFTTVTGVQLLGTATGKPTPAPVPGGWLNGLLGQVAASPLQPSSRHSPLM